MSERLALFLFFFLFFLFLRYLGLAWLLLLFHLLRLVLLALRLWIEGCGVRHWLASREGSTVSIHALVAVVVVVDEDPCTVSSLKIVHILLVKERAV